jgi:hypothetical protein
VSEQYWLIYTGAIAGVIGAVTGIAGAVLAFFAFRRTGQLKSLDLRLELRRTEATLQSEILSLVPLLERAKVSRTRLAAAQGSFHSGATKHWLSQWDLDVLEANSLTEGASVLDADCTKFSHAQLETRLITVHKLQGQVSTLSNKYKSSLAADDLGRERLQADQRVITQARIEGKL